MEFVATAPAAVPAIRIVEFNYHPAANPDVHDEEDMEFIEIQNVGTEAVDMSGVQIADIASTPYVFAGGTNLAAGERIVVAQPRCPRVGVRHDWQSHAHGLRHGELEQRRRDDQVTHGGWGQRFRRSPTPMTHRGRPVPSMAAGTHSRSLIHLVTAATEPIGRRAACWVVHRVWLNKHSCQGISIRMAMSTGVISWRGNVGNRPR